MEEENTYLRQRVAELDYLTGALTNKAIDLEKQIILNNEPDHTTPRTHETQPTTPASSPSHSENFITKEQELIRKQQEEKIYHLKIPCKKCKIYQEETKNMIQSIKSLEEEITVLKHAANTYIIQSSTVPPPPNIPLSNSFEALATTTEDNESTDDFNTVTNRKKKTKTNKTTSQYRRPINKPNTHANNYKKVQVPYRNVTVVGDSHCRGLAALMKSRITNRTNITGICKPGAGLLDIAPTPTPPDQHAFVVIAGTNDVAAGRQAIIFEHMENLIKKCKKSSRVLVSPLPPRHDLSPASPVHESVALVNHFISELCHRHEGVEVLDLSGLSRGHFTRHGQHLNSSGKNLLAGLISKDLAQAPSHPRQRCPPKKTAAAPQSWSPHSPTSLPHDTYSEAVIRGSTKRSSIQRTPLLTRRTDAITTQHCFNELSFLGMPLAGNGVNLTMV